MTVALVTGASGFIGSHLVSRCLDDGFDVKALVRKGNSRIGQFRRQGVDVVEGDLRDRDAVHRAVHGCDFVFHSAALASDWGDWEEFRAVNIEGTRYICEASEHEGVRRLVYLSTYEVFDHFRLERLDERVPYTKRGEQYPDTKIEGTEVVWHYKERGLSVSVVYPSLVFGPGDNTFFPLLADAIRKRRFFYWQGRAGLNLIFIDNLVDLLMLAATHQDASGEDFLACDGNGITLEELCMSIANRINVPAPSICLPFGLVHFLAHVTELVYSAVGSEKRPLLTRQAVKLLASKVLVDTGKARRLLGWEPTVPLGKGVEQTLDWLVSVDPADWKKK
ncbi:NAD-dependent epimerase/dehydratase family protein [Chlorobium phaeobacteroides]|uniref:NAD-dependent epimerase/dehydratase n=1 Tax=Chlorobium phaeobacteroides (strain DSM 266 / SMG 266 / 2430) TaxID=290317 RepID=A1BHC3_CHLPD|nr:NAD-dependent epimerase/dehydratase family protein [Chlorobium phaeobacteroides]ABL65800.1 NAD-dependent epimerase/dehydratase [Chlorobium phaeobacteroides DSM 266]